MKLRDLIGSRNVVGVTANTFRPVIVSCGSGGCGSSSCGGGGGCGFTIVACGHSVGGCGGGGGCSSYSYHHIGGCGHSSTSCGGGGCSSYSYHHFGCGGVSSGC